MAANSKGDCFYCGANLGKAVMEKHILECHAEYPEGIECFLLKIEGAFDKNYWLYCDIPLKKSLADIDRFLRKIWLECCGHLSEFSGPGIQKIGKSRKLKSFSIGDKILYNYDFGDTTEIIITVIAAAKRQPRRTVVRLLARNTPLVYKCEDCGEEAVWFSINQDDVNERFYYCDNCAGKKIDDDDDIYLLPVTNSPRMGQCAYDGELDEFEYPAWKFEKRSED